MRLKDIMTVDIVTIDPHGSANDARAEIATAAAKRSPLPTSLPRPTKLTRDRTYAVPPPAHVRVIGGAIAGDDRENITRKLGMKLGKFAPSIERISLRLSDVNGPKGGPDQICQIKVVLSGLPSIVIEETDAAVQVAIDRAINATALAVGRSLQRRRLKALHHRGLRQASHATDPQPGDVEFSLAAKPL